MIDINISLGKAYYDALSGIGGVPVYYGTVPSNISPDNYIVIKPPQNRDASTMNSSDTETSIVVEIHTFNDGVNSGLAVDQAAREVFNRILPTPSSTLTVDGAQMITTRLLDDRTQDFSTEANRGYVSRFLTFGHKFFLRSDIS